MKMRSFKQGYPILRFPQHMDPWEKVQLGDVAEINPRTGELPGSFIYIDLESVISGRLIEENQVLKEEAPSRAQRVLQIDDILFQMVRPYQKNNLYFDKNGDYVASTGYAQLRTKQNAKFIYQYLHLTGFVNIVIEKCTGTSYPSINSSDLSSIEIAVPSLLEQTKIASFLTAVDDKIRQLTRKKELLEQYKKGVIQKIFSQEIRFRDEQGKGYPEWEKKKLGEFVKEFNQNSVVNNEYEVLTSSNRGLMRQKDYFGENRITERENVGFNVIPQGYLTYRSRSDNRKFTFNINELGFTGIISTYYPVFTIVGGDNKFFLELFQMNQYYISKHSVGTSQVVLSLNDLKKVRLSIPSYFEQRKISTLLAMIDKKISLVSFQFEKMQTWKKGLLQKMFV